MCPSVSRGSWHHKCSSTPIAKPALPSWHPSPSNPPAHKSLFSVAPSHTPGNILSVGKLMQGDAAISERLAAAPAPGNHVSESSRNSMTMQSRQMAGTADPSSADPITGYLGGCTYPQGSGWQLFPSTTIKIKDADPHIPVLPGCLSTAVPPWPFGQEPIRS